MQPVIIALSVLVILARTVDAEMMFERSVSGNGGGVSGCPTATMESTAGQAAVGFLSSPTIRAEMGFWRALGNNVSGIPEIPTASPTRVELLAPIPNPARRIAMLRFSVPMAARVNIRLYDVSGREIRSLVDGDLPAGWHDLPLDTQGLSSGVYLCRMTSVDRQVLRRLILLK